MRRALIGASSGAFLVILALTGCTTTATRVEESPGPSIASPASPAPGDADYLPPAGEACEFLIGEGGMDYAAFIGGDLSGLIVAEDAHELVRQNGPSDLAAILDRGGVVCMMEPPHAGEYIAFAWTPIDAEERDDIIDSLLAEGLERSDSEGGSELRRPDAVTTEVHLVTNAGWYYSTQENGALYLRTTLED